MRTSITTRVPGGMFDQFEPAPAPTTPETAPLFDLPHTGLIPSTPDYGRPVAPTRDAVTPGLLDTTLVVGDNGALVFGIAETTAGTIADTTGTVHYLGVCTPCARPLRVDDTSGARYITVSCPECARGVRCERLVAVTTVDVCDARCMNATGPACSCACGGANHGGTWGGPRTRTDLRLISALENYRAQVAAKAAKKAVRAKRETDRRRAAFAEWAANKDVRPVLDFLRSTDINHPFLDDMLDLVDRHRPLTDGQLAGVARFADNARKAAERRAQSERRRAEGKAAPLGKGLAVEGVIVHVKVEDGYVHGTVTTRMLVDCADGYRVFATVPRSLTPVLTVNTFREMRGRKVRFVADLETPTKGDDPSFVIGKRPRKAQFVSD